MSPWQALQQAAALRILRLACAVAAVSVVVPSKSRREGAAMMRYYGDAMAGIVGPVGLCAFPSHVPIPRESVPS